MDLSIEALIAENNELKTRVIELEAHLSKYTNGESHKRYYQKNKDSVIQNAKTYLQKLSSNNPDKLKEYRRRAYLKRKDKLKTQLLACINPTVTEPM